MCLKKVRNHILCDSSDKQDLQVKQVAQRGGGQRSPALLLALYLDTPVCKAVTSLTGGEIPWPKSMAICSVLV